MSVMVTMHEAATEEEATRVCTRVEAVGEVALCHGPQSLPTAVAGEYAGRVLDLARWTGRTA